MGKSQVYFIYYKGGNPMNEKELLVSEVIKIQKSSNFEGDLREILSKYIVFLKNRLPRKDTDDEEIE